MMKAVFLDCQTTGMHPTTGHLLELAWEHAGIERTFLLRQPEGEEIPPRVTELTGIRAENLAAAVPPEEALAALEGDLQSIGEGAVLVAHYAQFERSFLADLWRKHRAGDLPWAFLCTHRIARLLFPEIPSRNIRALSGYFGFGESNLRRGVDHVRATRQIWIRLEPGLRERGLVDSAAISAWASKTKAAKPAKFEFRVDRIQRLALPAGPGVYRMLAQDGRVLYVGKATSLRERVNSYFRGRRGPGPRKREMLAQVYDIQVTECNSPLEAALLESEEIKRLDPPYNVSLKAGRRGLIFFSRDFTSARSEQDETHPMGPFGRQNALELLIAWREGLRAGSPAQVFYEELPGETLAEGSAIFRARQGITENTAVRSLLARGLKLYRVLAGEEAAEPNEEEAGEAEVAPDTPRTPAEVADWHEGLLVRAAGEFLRSRKLTRMLDCRVVLGNSARVLEVRGGVVGGERETKWPARWAGLGIIDYDRVSVLLTEANRLGYPVESRRGPW